MLVLLYKYVCNSDSQISRDFLFFPPTFLHIFNQFCKQVLDLKKPATQYFKISHILPFLSLLFKENLDVETIQGWKLGILSNTYIAFCHPFFVLLSLVGLLLQHFYNLVLKWCFVCILIKSETGRQIRKNLRKNRRRKKYLQFALQQFFPEPTPDLEIPRHTRQKGKRN